MISLEKQAVDLANSLLSVAIGRSFHSVRPGEERIDVLVADFELLRQKAITILKTAQGE